MLLRIFFIIVFILPFANLFANDSTLTWKQWTKAWEKKEINTARIDVKREKGLIKEIEVLDVRSDTERVGICTNSFRHPCEIVLDNSIGFLINKKLANNTATKTILLVIRNFWINKVQYFEGKLKAQQSVSKAALPSSKFTCSLDAFIKIDEKYFPLTQIDTVFTNTRNVIFSSHDFIEKALLLIQHNLEKTILLDKYFEKKQTDIAFIKRVYSKRFKISAISDSTFKKGIYYTWEQFKNNQPVTKEFSIKASESEPPSLFIKDENGNEILTRNVFAVNDGSNIYKIHQGFVFPIYRNNNAIYWMGLEQYDLKTKGAPVGFPLAGGWGVAGIEPIGATMKIRLTPYLLNLETGKEY